MAAVLLRFVGGTSFADRAIMAAQFGFWAIHCESLMPDGTLLGALPSGGVMARAHDYDAGRFDRQAFVQVPCSQAQADDYHAFLLSQIGKPYDVRAILAFAAAAFLGERDWREPDSWFCSEILTAALERAGIIKPLATSVNHVTPRDALLFVSAMVDVPAAA